MRSPSAMPCLPKARASARSIVESGPKGTRDRPSDLSVLLAFVATASRKHCAKNMCAVNALSPQNSCRLHPELDCAERGGPDRYSELADATPQPRQRFNWVQCDHESLQ